MISKSAFQAQQKVPGSSGAYGTLQRKCDCGQHTNGGGACTSCGKNRSLDRVAGLSTPGSADRVTAPPIVHEVLGSDGRPLDAATRAFFEPRFGHDFSRVRVHADGRSAEAAQAVSAKAFTVGESIYFGRGRYSPESATGRELMAHELAHVAQSYQGHGGTGPSAALRISHPTDALEREADMIASRVGTGTTHDAGRLDANSVVGRASGHSGLLLREMDEEESGQAAEELQTTGEESPCEKSSLKNERELVCPGTNDRSTWLMLPCAWTMFKNTGTCSIGVAHMNAAGEFPMIDFISPGETTEVHPVGGCESLVVTCMPDCSGRGHVKWGPPCIS